jgi:hypothetical protein
MSFDLAELTKGMTQEEAMEFVASTLTPEAAEKFKASKKASSVSALQKQYDAEMEKLPKGLSSPALVRKVSEIKAKYRRLGLQVF